MARSNTTVKAKAKTKAKPRTKAKAKSKAKGKAAAKPVAKRTSAAPAKPRTAARAAGKRAAGRPASKRSAFKRSAARRPAVRGRVSTPSRAGTKSILDLAQVIRSKNAGPFEVTFDIMFDSADDYRLVRDSGVITRKLIARLYGVSDNAVLVCRPYDPAQAIKITIRRPVSSGDIGDSDVYGCQQHVPLTSIAVPV